MLVGGLPQKEIDDDADATKKTVQSIKTSSTVSQEEMTETKEADCCC